MGAWISRFAALLALAACTACGPQLTSAAEDERPRQDITSAFDSAPEAVRRLAVDFVHAVCNYDSRVEGAGSFLGRLDDLATPAELRRLASSPRARLPWSGLRSRAERSKVTILGVTTVPTTQRVIVNATRKTVTSLAVIRDFVTVELTVVAGPEGLLVANATGAGL